MSQPQTAHRSGIKREPIFWLSTSEPANGAAERTLVRMHKGRRITEKVPQHGHDGSSDYENKFKARGRRFMWVVRHEGHEVSMVLTNAAAHLEGGPYANYALAKARHFGWYPSGQCPCVSRVTGQLSPHHFVSEEARTGEPCQGRQPNRLDPCPHDLAERKARAEQWRIDHGERMAAFKSDAEKLAAEQRAMNADLLKEMAVQVATIIAEAKEPPIAPAPPVAKPEKK